MAYSKKILLICGSATNGGIGDIFLRDIVGRIPAENLIRFTFGAVDAELPGAKWMGFSHVSHPVKVSRWPVLSTVSHELIKRLHMHRVLDSIQKIVKDNYIETVWIVLSSVSLISLAAELQKKDFPKLRSMIWDSPEIFFENQFFDPISRRRILRDFDQVLKQSEKIAVISEGMQKLYAERHQVSSIVIRHGAPENNEVSDVKKNDGTLKIVFAGSLYAKSEWNVFVAALDECDFKLQEIPIKVYFLGKFPKFGAVRNGRVEYMGQKPYHEAQKIMAQMDVAYLPYWFSRRRAVVVKSSFPGKLSAYAAAGLKVLFHGPEYSSVVGFLEKYRFGISCTSLDKKDVISALRKLAFDPEFIDSFNLYRQRAIREAIGHQAMMSQFEYFIAS